jgi:hypothetical protein
MGQTSTKFIYMKTCSQCLNPYWTTSKRTPYGICNVCYKTSNKKVMKPIGNLTKTQVNKYLRQMKKNCRERAKNDKIRKNTKKDSTS